MERVGPLYEDVDRQEAHAKKQVGRAALVPAHYRWTRASFRSLSRVNLVSPPKPWGRSPRRRGLEGAGRLRVAAGKRQSSPAFPIPGVTECSRASAAPGRAGGQSARHCPPRPPRPPRRSATHKLEDEEQVGEGGEDRGTPGQPAAARSRSGGHAGARVSASESEARASGSALTEHVLGEPGDPGAAARVEAGISGPRKEDPQAAAGGALPPP